MKVRPGRSPHSNRGSVAVGSQATGTPITFPAPKNGLVTNYDLLEGSPGAASILRNFFPTLKGARIRGGSAKIALLAGLGTIKTAFNYRYGSASKVFMATDTGIFEVTSPVAPPATVSPSLDGQTSGSWTTVQHTSQGASMMVCVNGSNPRQLYNGTGWVTAPEMTFTDGTISSQLNYVWLFKNREFFLKNGTMDAYYLPLNSFGGAAVIFPLGGVMKKGGSLLTGFSWSIESGDA